MSIGAVSTLVFGAIALIPDSWFVAFLGSEWAGTGAIIRVFCALNVLLAVDQSIGNAFLVYGREQLNLLFELISFFVLLIIIIIAGVLGLDLILFLALFVLTKGLIIFVRIMFVLKNVNTAIVGRGV